MRKQLSFARALALALAAAAVSAAGAYAQWGKGASLFTQDGVELSVDARVFAVFAMLNGIGYDRETLHGPAPLRSPQFAPAREATRNRIGRPGAAVRALGDVVKKHPAEPSEYVVAALGLGAAPRFSADKGASKLSKALAGPVSAWFNEEGGASIYGQTAAELGAEQKRLLDPVDALAKKLTKAARLAPDEDSLLAEDVTASGRVVVVLNPLDAHGTLQRVDVGDVSYVVTGPRQGKDADKPVVDAAALAYARTLVARDAEKHAGNESFPGQLFGKLDKDVAARIGDPKALAAEVVACALLRVVDEKAACSASPLEGVEVVGAALPEVEKRVKAYLAEEALLLSTAMPEILAALPAAPAPEAAPAPPVEKQATSKKK